MEIAKLRLGGDGVDLAHVAPSVFLSHVRDVQEPGAVLVVGDADAGVTSDHVVVHCQDR